MDNERKKRVEKIGKMNMIAKDFTSKQSLEEVTNLRVLIKSKGFYFVRKKPSFLCIVKVFVFSTNI